MTEEQVHDQIRREIRHLEPGCLGAILIAAIIGAAALFFLTTIERLDILEKKAGVHRWTPLKEPIQKQPNP